VCSDGRKTKKAEHDLLEGGMTEGSSRIPKGRKVLCWPVRKKELHFETGRQKKKEKERKKKRSGESLPPGGKATEYCWLLKKTSNSDETEETLSPTSSLEKGKEKEGGAKFHEKKKRNDLRYIALKRKNLVMVAV